MKIGNIGDINPAAPVTAMGAPQQFEIWWNDGKKWYSMPASNANTWKPINDLITLPNANPIDWSPIKKFNTNLGTNYNSIFTENNFPAFLAKEVRVVFDTFSGTVLAARLGIEVNDHNKVICPKKCTCADNVLGQQAGCPNCKSGR